jgi:uncharacterized short protein YbdD (DUF466 family)
MSHPAPLSPALTDDSRTTTRVSQHAPRSWRAQVARVLAIVRRIVGVPDYDAYLAVMRRKHPECTPMDARTFERERLAEKYMRPGSRCC